MYPITTNLVPYVLGHTELHLVSFLASLLNGWVPSFHPQNFFTFILQRVSQNQSNKIKVPDPVVKDLNISKKIKHHIPSKSKADSTIGILTSIFSSNISKGTAFLLQGVTRKQSQSNLR